MVKCAWWSVHGGVCMVECAWWSVHGGVCMVVHIPCTGTSCYYSNSTVTDQHVEEEPGVSEDDGAETRVADHPLQSQFLVEHLPLGGVVM